MGATVGLVTSIDSTMGFMASRGLTVDLATVSALMLNVDIGVKSRFNTESMESVEGMECMGFEFEFDNRFSNDLIARLRLCSFNTVCCICLMRLSLSLGRLFDLLVSALGFAPSLPGQN